MMERETGIEPATNSLDDCQSIENKQLLRLWRRILAIVFQQVSRPPPKMPSKSVTLVTTRSGLDGDLMGTSSVASYDTAAEVSG
jgi:hypothetical protein